MTKILRGAIGLFLPLLLVFAACKDEDERDPCFEPKNIYLSAGAYRTDTGASVRDTALPNLILGPVDSVRFLDFDANSRKFLLFLSPLQDSCRYYLQPDSGVSPMDTLTFLYTRRLEFLSNACGYTYFFNLQQVRHTRHMIDSVRIASFDVTNNASTEHLRVYFRK